MLIYHKNQYVNETELTINALAPGFQFGVGFFTTMKYDDGRFHYLDDHLERINQSLKDFNLNAEEINVKEVLENLIVYNSLSKSRIKIMCYLDVDNISKFVIIPQKLVLNNSPRKLKAKLSVRGTNQIYKYKSLNYFENIKERNLLPEEDVDDYVYYDDKNQVLEAVSSNIFFIKGEQIFTPSLELPILGGIYRKKICQKYKYQCLEMKIDIEKIKEFEACFLTNSIQEIIPVISIKYNGVIYKYDIFNKFISDLQKGLG